MGRHGPKKGGKSRHTRHFKPKSIVDYESVAFVCFQDPADSSAEGGSPDSSPDDPGLFYIDTQPIVEPTVSVESNVKSKLAGKGAITNISLQDPSWNKVKKPSSTCPRPTVSETSTGEDRFSDAERDYAENLLNTKSKVIVTTEDEQFEKLLQEYRTLMRPDSPPKDLEWQLDENAARLLHDRTASDSPYANIIREDFNQFMPFDKVYGVRRMRATTPRARRTCNINKGGVEFGENSSTTSNQGGEIPHRHDTSVNFKQLNREVKAFVRREDDGLEMIMEPHPPMVRKLMHELGRIYGLKSRSSGQGTNRHCIFVKCENTKSPHDHRRLDRFLENAQKAMRYACFQNSAIGKAKPQKNQLSSKAVRVAPGTIIGAEAAPIEEDNIGNKLLRKLGWSPGQGLGSGKEGRREPVEAVFRASRTGLGH